MFGGLFLIALTLLLASLSPAVIAAFLALGGPLQLGLHGITLVWAVEGPVLLYLGYRFDSLPVRVAAFAVLVLAAARLCLVHWPEHFSVYLPVFNRSFGSSMAVPAALACFGFIHYLRKDDAVRVDGLLNVAAGIAAGLITLMLLHAELGLWLELKASYLGLSSRYLAWPTLAVLWCLGAGGFLAAGWWTDTAASWIAGLAALCVALVLAVGSYDVYPRGDYILFVNFRFLGCLLAAVTLFGYAWVVHRFPGLGGYRWESLAVGLLAACWIVPLIVLSLETYVYCRTTIQDYLEARWMGRMSLSAVWATYAVGSLCVGVRRKIRPLRLAALGLLGITAVKLLMIDMSRVQQSYRIVSFVVLGLMTIGASYLYHRLEQQLAGDARRNEARMEPSVRCIGHKLIGKHRN